MLLKSYVNEILYFSLSLIIDLKHYLHYPVFVIILLVSVGLHAQQEPAFTHYREITTMYNPAFSGMREGISVNGLFRQQWAGFNDYETGENVAPEDYLVTIDSPIRFLHGGLGGAIIQDKATSNWSDITLILAYSYHAELSFGTLGIGLGLNLKNRSIDGSKYRPVSENDPAIFKSSLSDMRLDANAGLYFKSADNYYMGLSITNLLKTTFAKIVPEGDPEISTDRTLYLTGGYNFYLPNDQRFEIQPSFLIQSDLVSTQYNLTGIVNYNAKFWGGLNYRFGESVGVLVGMRFKDLGIGYSYDVNTLRLGVPGSHEISIGYNFKIKGDKSRTSYKNTRYL
ncbi:MAG: PorP/SprF family type IX secretion system membrane protein [Bacteroidales bacterium]|nr:PorP/SprF family type IX secretion system membrane protein [Bacteroidales bacterium]